MYLLWYNHSCADRKRYRIHVPKTIQGSSIEMRNRIHVPKTIQGSSIEMRNKIHVPKTIQGSSIEMRKLTYKLKIQILFYI